MPGIDNDPTPTLAHGTLPYPEVFQVIDVNENESRPIRPLLPQRCSPPSYSSYSKSTFSQQSTEYDSCYDQDGLKETKHQIEGTPKKVLQTGWSRFFQSWLVHTPAVLSTVAIVYIGSAQLFWFPEQGPRIGENDFSPSTIINLLQVAAKIHEIMMVLSLSSIVLAIYRRQLIGDGVRLGFLTAGYRVGDLGYILSSPFWRQGLDRTRPWSPEVLLCSLFVFATIMSATVGPASAVLLTPSLDWFDFAPGTAFSNMRSPLIYKRDRDHVWDSLMRVDNSSNQAASCLTPHGLYEADCPARGFRELDQWVRQWRATNLTSPILFQSVASDIGRRLKPLTDEERSVVLTTTPSDFLLNSIGFFQNYIAAADVGAVSGSPGSGKFRYRLNTTGATVTGNPFSAQLFQPLVQSKCQIYDKADFMARDEVAYPTDRLNCMGNNDCESSCASPRRISPRYSRFNERRIDNDVTNYLVDVDNSTVVYLSGQISNLQDDRQEDKVYLCSAVASWMPANYTFDPVKSNVLKSTLWNDTSMLEAGGDRSATGTIVSFTKPWLRLLSPSIDQTKSHEWSALDALTSHFKGITNEPKHPADHVTPPTPKDDDAAKEILLATAIGAYLTEALARTSTTGITVVKLASTNTTLSYARLDYQRQRAINNITVFNTTHLQNDATGEHIAGDLAKFNADYFERSLPVALVAERYGYGTGKPRKTLHFAQAMLAIYLGAVVLYAAAMAAGYVFARGRVLGVAAWSDLQDLLLLAIQTPPPGGDFAGATSSRVWEKIVRVRADDCDRVRLVMDCDALAATRPLGWTAQERYY
ncbi:uncharacterized protein PG998_003056 [Apiospora kogelbergensis]|uniref:uncharacterized protein n=1 Tax=Apiospora kogelbergensis TaxID=1337665 RepID=UPI003131DBCF